MMSRTKEKVVKEKGVMKTEISELYAQIEILQSEKISIKKVGVANNLDCHHDHRVFPSGCGEARDHRERVPHPD